MSNHCFLLIAVRLQLKESDPYIQQNQLLQLLFQTDQVTCHNDRRLQFGHRSHKYKL